MFLMVVVVFALKVIDEADRFDFALPGLFTRLPRTCSFLGAGV